MVAELVVVSWNIQGRDPASIDLPEAVRGWGADVLLLQEVRGQRLRDALPEYPTCLTWPLGIAIVSRFTHEEAGTAQGGVAHGQRPSRYLPVNAVQGAISGRSSTAGAKRASNGAA